jgi:hypothetical protein
LHWRRNEIAPDIRRDVKVGKAIGSGHCGAPKSADLRNAFAAAKTRRERAISKVCEREAGGVLSSLKIVLVLRRA